MASRGILPKAFSIILTACLFASHGAARGHHHHHHHGLHKRQSGGDLTSKYPTQNFTMPVDHFHNESRYEPHTNRTFQQHYWFDDTYYKPGGPIIVNTMGEDGTFDLTWFEAGLLQELANATGGMSVLWGQRYYAGNYFIVSQPYTAQNLRFHTTEQAMADLAYFAQRAKFQGYESKNLNAKSTPWIVIGGSYAGVISAFTRIQYPDLFWVSPFPT
jgi:Serine carboxypeptidase S28